MVDHKGREIEVGSKVAIPGVVTAIQAHFPGGEESLYIDIDTNELGGGDPQRIVVKAHHVDVWHSPSQDSQPKKIEEEVKAPPVVTPVIPESDLEKEQKEGGI